MSDPLSEECEYCGSPDVMDDAWFCASAACWAKYEVETKAEFLAARAAIKDAGLKPGDVLPAEGGLFPVDGDQVDITEAIELAAAALWEPLHEHDSFARGREWATAIEGVPGPLAADYKRDVARTRWMASTAITAAWDRLAEHFYAEAAEKAGVPVEVVRS